MYIHVALYVDNASSSKYRAKTFYMYMYMYKNWLAIAMNMWKEVFLPKKQVSSKTFP